MQLATDADVRKAAEFMTQNVPATKLVAVAETLLKIGRLLWSEEPQSG